MWQVEPVPSGSEMRCLELVVGAGESGSHVRSAAESLQGYLAGLNRADYGLWWARQGSRYGAGGALLVSPGRTGAILFSSLQQGLIDRGALTALIDGIAGHSLGPEMVLVQSLLPPESSMDIEAFQDARYELLAELVYMRQDLRDRPARRTFLDEPLEFITYSPRTHAMFASAIKASYVDSLDCPAMEGLRDIDDVLAGHKAAGIFRPELWTLALRRGSPAGVILLNQTSMQNMLEVVYMGVAKDHRGHGVGQSLLSHAAELALDRKFTALTLAVDLHNHYAMRLYQRAGFIETMRRLAYVRTFKRQID